MEMFTQAEVEGTTYQIGRLSPRKSFHVARRLAPFFGAIMPHLHALFMPTEDGKPPTVDDFAVRGAIIVPSIANVLAEMKDEDADYIFDNCLAVVHLRQDRTLTPVMNANGVMQFDNIDMKAMLLLSAEVIKFNLGDFFPTSQPPAVAEMTSTPQ